MKALFTYEELRRFARWRLTFTNEFQFPSGPPQSYPHPGSLTPSDPGFLF
jgi:hypothetical protein